jgi:hypothetical protein
VRVAVADDLPVGFSVVIPGDGAVHELDGLFVEPAHMYSGVGRALVEDAARGALAVGAKYLEVTGAGQWLLREAGVHDGRERGDALRPRCPDATRTLQLNQSRKLCWLPGAA